MVKRKSRTSLFSTLVQQITDESSSSAAVPTVQCHLIENEYFAAFNSLDDIQEFQQKLIGKQSTIADEEDEDDDEEEQTEMDMKTFAQRYLIDLPESTTTATNNASIGKRQRRNIRDLPQSSNFIFMSDNDHGNIFESLRGTSSHVKCIGYEDMSSILLTLDVKGKRKKSTRIYDQSEATVAIELAEPSLIKSEPIEPEQVCFLSHAKPLHSYSIL